MQQPLPDLVRERRTATPPYGGSLGTLSCASGSASTAAELDAACKATRRPMSRLHAGFDYTGVLCPHICMSVTP